MHADRYRGQNIINWRNEKKKTPNENMTEISCYICDLQEKAVLSNVHFFNILC